MAAPTRSSLLPRCTSCMRRVTRLGYEAWLPLQQNRCKSKSARQVERHVVVKLLHDVPRYGQAGRYIAVNPGTMRNRWFPSRIADYVPGAQIKRLKEQGVETTRDMAFGVKVPLEEDAEEEETSERTKSTARPIEIDVLGPERSMELMKAFIPPTIDFQRQQIEQDRPDTSRRYGASGAADILSSVVMANKPKAAANGIYGSVTTADIVATIKSALAHNDEAARVTLSEGDVKFITGHEENDASRVKQLGVFRVEIRVPGAEAPITRNIRVKPRES